MKSNNITKATKFMKMNLVLNLKIITLGTIIINNCNNFLLRFGENIFIEAEYDSILDMIKE